MARGWESKGVEEQMAESATSKAKKDTHMLSTEEKEHNRERQGLELRLAKVKADLAAVRDERPRQMLEAAKADIERKLRDI